MCLQLCLAYVFGIGERTYANLDGALAMVANEAGVSVGRDL